MVKDEPNDNIHMKLNATSNASSQSVNRQGPHKYTRAEYFAQYPSRLYDASCRMDKSKTVKGFLEDKDGNLIVDSDDERAGELKLALGIVIGVIDF